MEGPFDCFKRPDVIEQLRSHPQTRAYSLDSGFMRTIEDLQNTTDQQALASKAMSDPRLMQAMGALQGWRLDVTEDEVKHAEAVGDMPKRDAVQLIHYQYAHQFNTPAAAKEAGNKCFQTGEYSNALACYLKTLHLVGVAAQSGDWSAFPPPEPNLGSTLHSNCAAVLLKMQRPKEALDSCAEAIRVAPKGFDLSKVHHREAQAHEMLAKKTVAPYAVAAAWSEALKSSRSALTAAKASQAEAAEREGTVSTSANGTITHLQREVKRIKEAEQKAREALDKSKAQAAREAEAESRRATGVQQPSVDPASTPRGSLITKPTIGYVRDIDLSVFAAGFLAKELCELKHTWKDGEVKVTALNRNQSDIHASIKEKRGKRALYYDLTLMVNWTGKSKLGRSSHSEMQGVMKMYNVAQDTKFALGGDKETSYMYELGFATQFHGACEPWATQIKEEAAELFELISLLITGKLVPAVEKKGELVH
uniref:Uncharacterized protein n=1 Tax=Haptolina brevifila TaxID=156173 RepID=A0A7S2DKE3_9EUKA